MERVERLVVQVSESNRMLEQGGVARWRISLMLLDNTAELLLRLEFDERMAWNEFRLRHIEAIEGAVERGETRTQPTPFDDEGAEPRLLVDKLAELRRATLAPDEVDRVKNDFNRIAGYLAKNKFFPQSYATVLKRLHKYRNEVYHEDHVRPQTVETAAKLYTYVVCDIMKRVRPSMIAMSRDLPDLDELFPGTIPSSPTLSFLEAYADLLLAKSSVGTAKELAETLAIHLEFRLDQLDDDLCFIASNTGIAPVGDERRDATLDQVVDNHNAWTHKTGEKSISADSRSPGRWRAALPRLQRMDDYVKAFDKFANLENALEPLEEAVRYVVRTIDRKLEDESDRLRCR